MELNWCFGVTLDDVNDEVYLEQTLRSSKLFCVSLEYFYVSDDKKDRKSVV